MRKRTFLYNNLKSKLMQDPEKIIIRWWIFFPVITLMTISLITLKHTSLDMSLFTSTFIKQLIWFGIGCVVFLLSQWLRIQFFQEYAFHLYAVLLILIGITYFMPAIGGSHRWVSLVYISFQPSELGKLFLVFIIARVLSEQQDKINEIKLLILTLLIAIIPSFMIFQQPDFGTAIVYGFIAIPMLYWSGIRSFYLFAILAPLISIISAFNIILFSVWMGILILVLGFYPLLSGTMYFILTKRKGF